MSTRTKGSLAQWKELGFAVHGAGAPTSVRLESAVCVVLGMWRCPSEPPFLTYRLGTTPSLTYRLGTTPFLTYRLGTTQPRS